MDLVIIGASKQHGQAAVKEVGAPARHIKGICQRVISIVVRLEQLYKDVELLLRSDLLVDQEQPIVRLVVDFASTIQYTTNATRGRRP